MHDAQQPATKKDLQKVDVMVDKIEDNLQKLKDEARNEFKGVKGDIKSLKTDVKLLSFRMTGVEGQLSTVSSDLRRLEVLQEEMNDHLKAMLETLGPKMEDVTANKHAIEDHEARITTLETFKKAAA